MRSIRSTLVVGFTLALAGAAAAQPATFILDLAAPSTQEVALTVQSPTTLPVKIIRTGAAPAGNVTLDVTAFTNEQGLSKRFTIAVEGASGPAADHLEVPFAGTVLSVDIQVPELPTGGKYTGRLIVSSAQAQPTIWRFVLTAANELRPATLVLDQNAVTLTAVRPWCVWFIRWCPAKGDHPVVTVHARDKTGSWPLDGVFARLEPGLKAPGPGFDPSEHIVATFDGHGAPDLFVSAGRGQRHVDPRGQAAISLSFTDLDAGEYTIPLRFTAMNSADDDLQRLSVVVQMRNNLTTAILILLLAAQMSFLGTRVVTTLRQRATFLGRVRAMRPAWLAQEPATLSVVWLRSTLRQAEKLSSRYWLTGQGEIDARLTGAAGMLAVLDRVRQVRERIDNIPEATVRLRATWKLDAIIKELPAAALTEQDAARFKSALDVFEAWFDPDLAKREKAYWDDLLPAIKAKYSEVALSSLPDDGKELAGALASRLYAATQTEPADLKQKMEIEHLYARLGLLWEARNHPAWVKDIVALHPGTAEDKWGPIEDVYRIIDDGWWNILAAAETKKSVEVPATSSLEPPEAYDSILFQLNVDGDPGLLASYMVRKKARYRWTFDVFSPRPIWKRWWGCVWGRSSATRVEPVGKLEVVTTQPQVARYSPQAGTIIGKVKITYQGRELPEVAQAQPVAVRRSSDFGVLGAFERADAIGFVAVLIASVISGITIYALSPTFGSLKEYLALFTWGASLDQGKNFVQALAAYSSTTAAAPAATGATTPTAAATPARPS